jgi:glycosyltransferase involved in cell wall biosynthesis
MNKTKKTYTGQDLAFIIPTKDRPEKVKTVLDSIARQTVPCGRIIVVDGGQSVKDIVMSFSDRLPVEYYACYPPGQILQRNMGISLLDERTPLVASLDDDIVLEPFSLEAMIAFWNRCTHKPAAVAFNIVNNPRHRYSWPKALLNMSVPEEGCVLKSGYNTAFGDVDRDLKVQWVYGGATVWQQNVLKKYPQHNIISRWATCEDMIYSYPISKKMPLYVCAGARVRHEHIYSNRKDPYAQYRGKNVILWRLYFIQSNPELSAPLFLFTQAVTIPLRLIRGPFSRNRNEVQYALGQVEGFILGIYYLLRKKDLFSLINEDGVIK